MLFKRGYLAVVSLLIAASAFALPVRVTVIFCERFVDIWWLSPQVADPSAFAQHGSKDWRGVGGSDWRSGSGDWKRVVEGSNDWKRESRAVQVDPTLQQVKSLVFTHCLSD